MNNLAPEARSRPATEPEAAEHRPADDRDARDRELIDYLIEVTWAAYIHRLRSERELDRGD
jgi:hypothetical protein